MEKRAILFLALSVTVLFLYMKLIEKLGFMPQLPPAIEQQIAEQKAEQDNYQPQQTLPTQASQPITAPETFAATSMPQEKETVIETDLYRAVFSNHGGVIKEWSLKQYAGNDGRPVQLLAPSQDSRYIYPLTITQNGTSNYFTNTVYLQEGEDSRLNLNNKTAKLIFYSEQDGKKIKKTLFFSNDSYKTHLIIETEGLENGYEIALGTNFGIFDLESGSHLNVVGPAAMIDGDMNKYKTDDIEEKLVENGEIAWVAQQDKYFISALIPQEKATKFSVIRTGETQTTVFLHVTNNLAMQEMTLFAGPKKNDILKNTGLEPTLNYGWFIFGTWSVVNFFAKVLFFLLNRIYSITGNYGIAIVVLTTLIKVLFFPLTHKSFTSMKGMQAIQPKVKAMQAKYKNDKQKLNIELMALYKTHKVNPMSGCLPILMQLPVFIALYNILFTSIELRHAPFLLWMTDLSTKDPYYILPLVMGASMFYQQKIQPTQVDPSQAKIMLMMPIVFTFMFLNFPSGLVLYWLTNNILTISQQCITQKLIAKKSLTTNNATT